MAAVSKKIETKKYVRILKAPNKASWYADKIGQVFEVEREGVNYLTRTRPNHLSAIRKEDAELIITEKRPANRNDRILITNADTVQGLYKNGDEFVVDMKYAFCGNDVIAYKEYDINRLRAYYVIYKEYEVIVNNGVKVKEVDKMDKLSKELNKRLDGGVPAPVTFNGSEGAPTYNSNSNLASIEYGALVEHAYSVLVEIERRAFEQGLEKGKLIGNGHEERPQEKTAQERRDEIVEQAKADIDGLKKNHRYRVPDVNSRRCYFICYAEFIVNREKRTVVALLRGVDSHEIFARGIAKAAPDDCFNVHIGKAIALHRALGLEVPDEYLNVPQPTEVREGDVVQAFADGDLVFEHMVKGCEVDYIQNDVNTRGTSWYAKIIDDSRTGSIES